MSAISPIFAALFRRLLVCLFGAALMFCASLSAAADEDFVCPDYVMESFRNEGLASLDRMDASRMDAYRDLVGRCARAADENGRTILHDAIVFKNNGGFGEDIPVSEVVQMLIDYGADVNAKGSIVLGGAVLSGGDLDSIENIDITPLHEAAYVNDIESARLLLANGADVNAGAQIKYTFSDGRYRYEYNYTPLFDAVRRGGPFPEMVRLLMDKEADAALVLTTKLSNSPDKQETVAEWIHSLTFLRGLNLMQEQCARAQRIAHSGGEVTYDDFHADEYRKYAEILALLGDDWECVLEAQEHDDLSQKVAESIDVLNAAGAALAMAGNAAGFKRAHPLIDYNQNGGSFGFAWTVSDEYMLVGLDDTIGLTWSGDRWTVKSQLIGGDKLSSSLSAGWEITF